MTPPPFVPTRTKRFSLWPLYFLPFLGLIAGVLYGQSLASGVGADPPYFLVAISGAYGFAAGTALMMSIAIVVLAFRIGRQRFTISAILIAVAVFAVFLALIRAMF